MAKQKLPPNVILLSSVSLFADISSEMIYPLLPVFVVSVLGAPATALGGIEGVAMATVAFLTAFAGWHSDKIRKRAVYVRWGYGLPVLGKAILAAATIWPMVLLGRAVDRVGKGLRSSPRDALIADAVDSEQRGRAFGFHRAMDTTGAIIGVLLAAALLATLFPNHGDGTSAESAPTFRWMFAIAAAFGLASLALTFWVKENPSHAAATPSKPTDGTTVHEPFTREFWLALLVLAVFAIANSSDAFLLLRASNVGLSPLFVVLAYATYNFSYALISYPVGVLSDRFGRWRMIAAGWVIYALVYVGFALVTEAWSVWPLMIFYGCYMAMTDGVSKALIADHAPKLRRATAMGILHMTLGLCVLTSSVVAGLLWDTVGPAAPFWFGAGAAGVAVVLLVALRPMLAVKSA